MKEPWLTLHHLWGKGGPQVCRTKTTSRLSFILCTHEEGVSRNKLESGSPQGLLAFMVLLSPGFAVHTGPEARAVQDTWDPQDTQDAPRRTSPASNQPCLAQVTSVLKGLFLVCVCVGGK